VEAEQRRGMAHHLAWPRGRTSSALILNHEIPVQSNDSTEAPRLLTLKQAAQQLAVCRRTLERLIAQKEFPEPLKVLGSSRVHPSDVSAFIEGLIQKRGAV
jgi:excisionase family DNA binding protein